MNELADYRRSKKEKYCVSDFPETILDVIETDYPDQYFLIRNDQNRFLTLFSNEELIDIMTKSRNSYQSHIQQLGLTKKYLVQGI